MGLQDVGNRAASKAAWCLTNDLKLANDGVLPVRSGNEYIMTHGDIGLDFFDGI
jgi:hypothetical protein